MALNGGGKIRNIMGAYGANRNEEIRKITKLQEKEKTKKKKAEAWKVTSKQLKNKSSTLNQKLLMSYTFLYDFLWAGHFFTYTTFIILLFPVIRPQ